MFVCACALLNVVSVNLKSMVVSCDVVGVICDWDYSIMNEHCKGEL